MCESFHEYKCQIALQVPETIPQGTVVILFFYSTITEM
jgi:hypothetical protein